MQTSIISQPEQSEVTLIGDTNTMAKSTNPSNLNNSLSEDASKQKLNEQSLQAPGNKMPTSNNQTTKELNCCENNAQMATSPAVEKPSDKTSKSKPKRNRELDKLEDTPIIHSRLRSESGKVYSSTVTLDANTNSNSLEVVQEEEADMCSSDCCKKSDQIISMIARLQTSIDDITTKFSTQESLQSATSVQVKDLQEKTAQHDQDLDSLQNELGETKFQLKLVTSIVSKQDQQIQFLSKKILEIQQREMAANVVITGILERKNENGLQLFNNFVTTNLQIQELIPASRAYRIGSGPARPLVVELRSSDHKKKLFANATKLKGQRNADGGYYFLADHLPEQLNEDRRRTNELLSENRKKPAAYQLDMSLKKGSLVVNQEPYKKAVQVPTIKNIVHPSESLYEQVEEAHIIKGGEETKGASKFVSFAVAVNNFEEINAAYLKLRMKYADATHISCAYRLPGANTPSNQDYVDDGEFGCGRTALKAIKTEGIMNIAVFIMRYYGGSHLGAIRFDIFKRLAQRAIKQLVAARQQLGVETTLHLFQNTFEFLLLLRSGQI